MLRIIILVLFISIASFIQAQNDILTFPFSYQEKYGLVSFQGDIILEPTYDNIYPFENNYRNNYTLFYQGKKYGILNKEGKEVIPATIDHMEYDGNGGFVWHYSDYPNMLGLSIFSLKNQKVVAEYESDRAWNVLGEGPHYLIIKDENTQSGFVINTDGKKLFDVPNGMAAFIEFPKSECPLLSFGNTSGYPRRTYFDCSGAQMSFDDYLDKYEIEEEMPAFADNSIMGDAGESAVLTKEKVQSGFPDLQIKELVFHKSKRLVSVIAINENGHYGLIDAEGKELIPFEYSNIHLSQNYLRTSKYAYRGLYNIYGEEVFPTIYGRIEYYPQDKGYFRIYTHSGYMGFGSLYGNVFLPKDIPLE